MQSIMVKNGLGNIKCWKKMWKSLFLEDRQCVLRHWHWSYEMLEKTVEIFYRKRLIGKVVKWKRLTLERKQQTHYRVYIRKEIVSFETLTLDNDIQFSNKDRKRLWTVNLWSEEINRKSLIWEEIDLGKFTAGGNPTKW